MSQALMLQPDTEFIHSLIAAGGGDLKKCYQCATCSSVCSLSSEHRPFPRKQVLEAQWGLKDQLMGDPAVWLCHDCGDCTVRCPRDARPSTIMAAVRGEAIKTLAVPRFMGNIVAYRRAVWLLFVLPVVILCLLAVWPPQVVPSHSLEFAQVFPQARVDVLFTTLSALVLLVLFVGAVRFLRALRASGADGPIIPALIPALIEIVTHRRFAQCTAEKNRRWSHLLVLYGFVGLFIVTTIEFIGTWLGVMHTPLPLLTPLKVFANGSALIISVGVIILILERRYKRENPKPSTYFDWFFLLTLTAVVATGVLSELLRLGQYKFPMFITYFLHLTFIFALFLSTPYSKFAHFLYRTLAMAATWEGDKASTNSLSSQSRSLSPAAGGNASAAGEARSNPTSS